jgi:UDP-N-acetylmuramoyl-tripeptide--D-alanyl-D-alanine ligase
MPGRHIAVLGAMAELGPVEEEEHVRIGTLAADLGFATVVTVGADPGIGRGAGPIARPAADPSAALRLLHTVVAPGDIVLVKASRAIGLEGVAAMLREEAGA